MSRNTVSVDPNALNFEDDVIERKTKANPFGALETPEGQAVARAVERTYSQQVAVSVYLPTEAEAVRVRGLAALAARQMNIGLRLPTVVETDRGWKVSFQGQKKRGQE